MASNEPFTSRFFKNTTTGSLGGISNCLVGHPFDTLKVRLQTQPAVNPVYKGLIDCFLKTLKWEGIGGLYKGVGSPIVGQMFFRATLFSTYFQSVSSMAMRTGTYRKRIAAGEYYLCGMVTGGIVSFVDCPMELFKCQMQLQIIQEKSGAHIPMKYRSVFHCAKNIISTRGFLASYQGLLATMTRNMPSYANFFCSYEITRNVLAARNGRGDVEHLSFGELLFAGGVGGFLYWIFTYPTDVVKSSIQGDYVDPMKRKYKGIIHCTRTIYKTHGWRGFYRGFSPCMLRSVPANSAMFVTVEFARRVMYPTQ